MKNGVFIISLLLYLCFSSLTFVCEAAGGDLCSAQGITVRNLSLDDKWYKNQEGQCTLLKRNYSFTIKPDENIGVYLDMLCEEKYCPSFTYTDYESSDQNHDCRVKILPGCVIEDM